MDFQSVSFDPFSGLLSASPLCGVLASVWMKHDSEPTDNRLISKLPVMLLIHWLLRGPDNRQHHARTWAFFMAHFTQEHNGDLATQVKQERERAKRLNRRLITARCRSGWIGRETQPERRRVQPDHTLAAWRRLQRRRQRALT